MIRLWLKLIDFLRMNLPLENFDSKHLKMSNLGNTTLILLVVFSGGGRHISLQGGPPTSYKWSYDPFEWPKING